MLEGGTAVDGAIAGLFCNGVYSSQVNSITLHLTFSLTIYFRAWAWAVASWWQSMRPPAAAPSAWTPGRPPPWPRPPTCSTATRRPPPTARCQWPCPGRSRATGRPNRNSVTGASGVEWAGDDGSNVLCRHFHNHKLETASCAHSEDVQGGHHGVLDPGREAQVGQADWPRDEESVHWPEHWLALDGGRCVHQGRPGGHPDCAGRGREAGRWGLTGDHLTPWSSQRPQSSCTTIWAW